MVKPDEPRTRQGFSRESSQHQEFEFELNQPTSVQPLSINDIGYTLCIIEGPTAKHIFKKGHAPQISSTHMFDQTSISGPLHSNAHSLVNLVNHDTIWSKAHRHITTYLQRVIHVVKWQEQAAATSEHWLVHGQRAHRL